ncbi:unnamed protein product [Discosporangium mesarthrocarpum]
MEPAVRAAVTAFVLEEAVPVSLACLVAPGPTGLDLRDANAASAVNQMGLLLAEARAASGGSASFISRAAAAVVCGNQPQLAEQLQQAVAQAADGAAIADALKAFSRHLRPTC